MKKEEFLKKEGLKIRKATAKDKAYAKTDYQRSANYIIKTKSGKEYFSKNGSVADCKTIMNFDSTTTRKPATRTATSRARTTAKARKAPVKKTTTRKPTTKRTTKRK